MSISYILLNGELPRHGFIFTALYATAINIKSFTPVTKLNWIIFHLVGVSTKYYVKSIIWLHYCLHLFVNWIRNHWTDLLKLTYLLCKLAFQTILTKCALSFQAIWKNFGYSSAPKTLISFWNLFNLATWSGQKSWY